MPVVRANAIDIEYEAIGPRNGSPMVLIMGLGMQLTAWPDEFCQGLAHRGFRVVRFDNRDTGLSTKTPPLGPFRGDRHASRCHARLPVRRAMASTIWRATQSDSWMRWTSIARMSLALRWEA